MIHHVRSTSESHIRWSSKKMQDLLDRRRIGVWRRRIEARHEHCTTTKGDSSIDPVDVFKRSVIPARMASPPGSPDRFTQILSTHRSQLQRLLHNRIRVKGKGRRRNGRMAVLQTGRSRKAGRVHLLLILCEVCTIFCLQPHCFHRRHVFIFALPDPRVSNASHAPSSYLSQIKQETSSSFVSTSFPKPFASRFSS